MSDEKKTLLPTEKEYFMSIKKEDISRELLQELFATRYDTTKQKTIPPKFHTYDEFKLKKGESFNKEDITTNCGLYIVNIFLFERFKDIVGYINVPLDKKADGKVNSKIESALMEDKITSEQYIDYLNDATWLKFIVNTEVSTSLTVKSMQQLPEVTKAKSEMVKKYKTELENGDLEVAKKMEGELLKVAEKEMSKDPSMELLKSGARGSFDVAYKSAQVMNGPVYNPAKGKYDIVTNSLSQGIDKKDIPTMANVAVEGNYSKAVASGECGYLTKKFYAAMQSETLDKKGTDCGTLGYNEVILTNDNLNLYTYCYMKEGSKLVRLEPNNADKYIGKTVKFRSIQYCIGKSKRCNMCAGDKYYMLGIENIGLTAAKISGALLNYRMKAIHDPNVKIYEIDINTDFV